MKADEERVTAFPCRPVEATVPGLCAPLYERARATKAPEGMVARLREFHEKLAARLHRAEDCST